MASFQSAQTNENNPPQQNGKAVKSLLSNAQIICHFRTLREGAFNSNNMYLFQTRPLSLSAELPLPSLPDKIQTFKALSTEHLQDFCNKATTIYCTHDYMQQSTIRTGRAYDDMYKYILDKWSHGDIHTTDIEFSRFFGKLVEVENAPKTQEIIPLHGALCAASDASRKQGFTKKVGGTFFKSNCQVEFYNIKPLCRALIIIIEHRFGDGKSQFDNQMVRLVRTGVTEGLSQPITFDNISCQEEVNEDEVIVTLPEAMKFIMDLDKREEALREPRDMSILDENLESPELQIKKYFSNSKRLWTGGKPPGGPPTTWWAEGKRRQKLDETNEKLSNIGRDVLHLEELSLNEG